MKTATIGDSVKSIEDDTFYDCSLLTSVIIPNSVTSIGRYAFYGCSSLKTATIGNSVTSIGESAFRDCSILRDIYCKNPEPPTCQSNYVFKGVKIEYCRLHVPVGCREDYFFKDYWHDFAIILDDINDEEDASETEVEELQKEIEILKAEIAGLMQQLVGDINKDGSIDVDDVVALLSLDNFSGDPNAFAMLANSTYTQQEIIEKYGDVEYYTLDGIRVTDLSSPGIYVVKKDGVTKIIVIKN